MSRVQVDAIKVTEGKTLTYSVKDGTHKKDGVKDEVVMECC